MRIIILHLGHNTTVSYLKDHQIIEVVSQEKFDNIKNSLLFPMDAINYILDKYILDAISIDRIIIASSTVSKGNVVNANNRMTLGIERNLGIYHKMRFLFPRNRFLRILSETHKKLQSKKGFIELNNKIKSIGFRENIIYTVDHHTCHAYSPIAIFGDNSDDWLIFTMDGGGEGLSSTVSIYKNRKLSRIAATIDSYSLGTIYGRVTELLGMKSLEHEYKVMGLAAYSKKNYYMETYNKIFKNIVTINDDLTFKSRFDTNFIELYLKKKTCVERFDNIAGALQHFTEELVTKWISAAIKKTGIKNIMTSGGVFMNVKMNQKILSLPEVEKAFFMPSCGDESNVFGAAAYFVKNELKKDIKQNLPIYFGMEYSNSQVEEFININKLADKYNVKYVEDIEIEIARLLADFNTVARFAGRTEFGARSLGNRALLANPSDMKSFYTVNDQIKVRDFWMPFAPSMLDTYADKYLINYDKDKYNPYYMMATYESTKEFQKHCRAAMHQGDKTARPQIVTKEMNSKYYKVIKEFEKLTGIGAILNTSFNLHGYPLVGTLEQAIFTFENSGPGYLAIENWLVSKK